MSFQAAWKWSQHADPNEDTLDTIANGSNDGPWDIVVLQVQFPSTCIHIFPWKTYIPLENLYSPGKPIFPQEQSQIPSFSSGYQCANSVPYLDILVEAVRCIRISPAFWRLVCVPDISELTTPMPGSSSTRLGATLLETLAMGTLTMSPCRS